MNRPKSFPGWRFALLLLAALGAATTGLWHQGGRARLGPGGFGAVAQPVGFTPMAADAFDGAVAWFNTAGPIKLSELKGKIVVLDFWTYCCINCHHMLPVLAKIEEKYKNEVVVVGVHTPKFSAEQESENIRKKIHEYQIKHPVISDANMTIWHRFGVESWPTLVVIAPDGTPLARNSGEISFEALDRFIANQVVEHKAELNLTPIKFFPENEKPDNTPLLFPGKVLADAASKRLFISDTAHNRLVMTDLAGKSPVLIGNGSTGLTDGSFEKAEFNRPQGMTLVGETLYVADTENHAIRAVDLKSHTVTTVAGTGQQAQRDPRDRHPGPGKTTALNSPWDLAHVHGSRVLYIAMAGPHQIWKLDLATDQVGVFAGSGVENIVDGPLETAAFAQPSGLATDGNHLFVADSEVSAVRSISLLPGRHTVGRIVGEGLFEFGDIDGKGGAVRLQHCLGIAWGEGKLFIADTYNNKIKICDPKTRAVKSLVGTGKPGETDQPAAFYQPGGISVAGTKLYVADTNNSKIRVVDLANDTVSTLEIGDLSPPKPPARRPVFPNAIAKTVDKVTVSPGKDVVLDVTLPIPEGFHLNTDPLSKMPYVVESPQAGVISPKFPVSGERIDPPSSKFKVSVPLAKETHAGEQIDLKLSVQAFVCSEGSNLCTIKSYVLTIPVEFASDAPATAVVAP